MVALEAQRTVDIEAVGGAGDGVARDDAGAPLYVPFTLPGERAVVVTDGDRVRPVGLPTISPERVRPPCPHFGLCGGCALQHWAHAPYLAWKVDQIRAALARERIETDFDPAFAAPPGSRRRVALHARPGRPARARLQAPGRLVLVDIAVCPISDPRLVAAFPALRRLGGAFSAVPSRRRRCTSP
jgi:23S rRNA (uracil1939-C5)-methyltransferase